MATDRELLRRSAVGVGIVAVFLVVAYALIKFVAVAVFSVFLYYAVLPIFRFLARFGLGRRVRALLSILFFGLPFLVLLGYTIAIVAVEIQSFVTREELIADGTNQLIAELNIANLDLEALQKLAEENSQVSLDVVADSLLSATSLVGSVFVQLLLVVIVSYYLLVDGPKLVSSVLDTYDEAGVVREYTRAVDAELSLALFGNIVNVFITAIIGVGTFYIYNVVVVSTVAVPFPALLGALAGIGSLVPVVGIKFVYVPLCLGLGANAWAAGHPELLAPVAVLFVVSAVVVDFIPDFVIRAQVSSDETHTGLLLISYIVGPVVFGFYGLFLAPIVLVGATNAMTILLPYALAVDRHQLTLDRFDGQERWAGSDRIPDDDSQRE
jgi:predicted PurR-regulated permease PerM